MAKVQVLSWVLALLIMTCPAFAKNRIVVVSDHWMPYNGTPNSSEEGYAVDILRAIFEPKGYVVAYSEQPWKRAIAAVEKGHADMLIGAFKFEMPSFIFPETIIGVTRMGFYSNSKTWKFKNAKSLKGINTGIVKEWGYRPWLLDEVQKNPHQFTIVHGENAFPRLVQMLVYGRIHAIPSSVYPMSYHIKKNALEGKVFFAGFGDNSKSEKLYYALSPANSDRSNNLAMIIDDGIISLRNSGELLEILYKYGLDDWE